MTAYWLYFTDEEVLEAIGGGEPGAREELAGRYADRIYDFCARMTNDPARAARVAADVFRRHVRNGIAALGMPLRTSLFSMAYARCDVDAREAAARELTRYGLTEEEIAVVVGTGVLTVQRWLADTEATRELSAIASAPREVHSAIFEKAPVLTVAAALGPRRRSRITLVLAAAAIAIFSAFGIARAFEPGEEPDTQREVSVGLLTTTTSDPDVDEPTTATTHPGTDLVVTTTTQATPTNPSSAAKEKPRRTASTARVGGASSGSGVTAAPPPPTVAPPTAPPATPPPTTAAPSTTASTSTTTTSATTTTTLPPGPFTADPPEVAFTGNETRPIVLTRTAGTPGTPALTIVFLAGTDPGWFELVSDDCTGAWLDVLDTCTVEVRPRSNTTRTREAVLRVETSPTDFVEVPLRRN